MEFTNDELQLLLFVLDAHSASIKIKAASGKYNKAAADNRTKRMCELSSKIYQEIIKRAE